MKNKKRNTHLFDQIITISFHFILIRVQPLFDIIYSEWASLNIALCFFLLLWNVTNYCGHHNCNGNAINSIIHDCDCSLRWNWFMLKMLKIFPLNFLGCSHEKGSGRIVLISEFGQNQTKYDRISFVPHNINLANNPSLSQCAAYVFQMQCKNIIIMCVLSVCQRLI